MDINALLLGKIFNRLSPASLNPFLLQIQNRLQSYFPEGDPRQVVACLSSPQLLTRMKLLRDEIISSEPLLHSLCPVWSELGFDLNEIFLDAIRIRCVPDKFHENVEAKSVSYIHRDPWYANPQCQLNFWIPIYDVEKGAGFSIYPPYFKKAIPNNSDLFDYQEWLELGGFQSNKVFSDRKQIFPAPLYNLDEVDTVDIHSRAGEMICFASHHLHGTSPNLSGLARFTLEVRFVLRSHLESRVGPKKLDNFSKGSTLIHMYDLFRHEPVPKALIKHYEDGFVPEKSKQDS